MNVVETFRITPEDLEMLHRFSSVSHIPTGIDESIRRVCSSGFDPLVFPSLFLYLSRGWCLLVDGVHCQVASLDCRVMKLGLSGHKRPLDPLYETLLVKFHHVSMR